MAAAQGHLSDGPDDADGEGTPSVFRQAVAGLQGVRLRPEIELDATPPPQRLAPYSYALEAAVVVDDEELADGRLILLHDPAGHDAWGGTFRLVTLVHAELEPEMAADPLLPEVCWSWLTGALEARRVPYAAISGTVTRAASHYFGGLREREPSTRIEIRASWSPTVPPAAPGAAGGVPDTAAHLSAWCDLLCQIAGLPPGGAPEAGIVTLPQRRGPHSR
ncbi:DUF3000 domain-containing protein [Streptomyces triculaminicus]|uniref:DUF3000 domain-containing protein n=2 Tax=Streptomyces TaxID=1883 RepID=A0A939JSP7_9ACTN|nr:MULTISPECIES: DUF3000 domain-containing protein [Streptomyces]MBO0655590.1 DUF3000 domain-containing protein [Streptomyces triculaminicus]QSY50583.1 DUF3000 domain-containing protein [Streptomyces griseocarneus]